MRFAMLLGPLSAALGIIGSPIPRGCIELPTAYGEHVWGMFKGAHKYLKRVPIGTTATGKTRYRYYYSVGHGGGIDSHEHMVEGARFAHGDGHFHIVKQDGDKLHVRNTATGEEHTTTKRELAQKLAEHHAEGIKAYRDRAGKALAEAKANKASPKQIARLEERVKRAGAKTETIKHEDAVLSEVPEYQRRSYRGDTAKELREKAASVRDMAKRAQERNQGGPSSSIDSDRQSRIDTEKRRHAAEAAEHEANASFLERLADAKDKDAGKETPKPATPAPKETPKPTPESKPDSGPASQVKSMRTSQIEGAANNPRHPMHEVAKAELERREKSVTPQQAIEIARKQLAIERRHADGAEAGRRAHSSQSDEAVMDAFARLTSKQSKAAMDALDAEDKVPAKPSTRIDRSYEAQRPRG